MSYNPSQSPTEPQASSAMLGRPAELIGAAVASGHIPGVVGAAGRGPATASRTGNGRHESR